MQSRIRTHNPLRAQKLYNLRKAAYIAQIHTPTYTKAVQPVQRRMYCAKLYTNEKYARRFIKY